MQNTLPGPAIGVVTISYNEELDMPGFLENLLPWVDEIIIVDDGSTDRTPEIARAAGSKVKFVISPRRDGEYFSHQRNKGIELSSSEWLLHMDVDERVPEDLKQEILSAIHTGKMEAYRYRRLNFFLHRPMKGGGWQDWNLVHLARRNVFRFAGMYHEECIVSCSPEKIGQLEYRMWHLNEDGYRKRIRKSLMYCEEQVTRLKSRGVKINAFKLVAFPFLEFANKYIRKAGFRDGVPGLLFALHAATAMFKACAILWDEQNAIPRESIQKMLRSHR